MKAFIAATIVTLASLISVYAGEALLYFVLVKSLPGNFIPPGAVHHDQRSEYDVVYQYNNLGLRGDDFSRDQLYDVTLLGDSFFFGQGVDLDKTLYRTLKERHLTVLNASEIGSNPIHYFYRLSVLRSLGLQTHHVIVGFFIGNDFQDIAPITNLTEALNRPYDQRLLEYDALAFLSLDRSRFLCSAVWQKVFHPEHLRSRAFVKRKRFRDDWIEWLMEGDKAAMAIIRNPTYRPVADDAEFLAQAQINPASIAKTAQIINAIAAKTAPARMSLMLIPSLHAVRGELGEDYAKAIANFRAALTQRIEVIDLHRKVTPEMYYPNDGHWNALGQTHVARFVQL